MRFVFLPWRSLDLTVEGVGVAHRLRRVLRLGIVRGAMGWVASRRVSSHSVHFCRTKRPGRSEGAR